MNRGIVTADLISAGTAPQPAAAQTAPDTGLEKVIRAVAEGYRTVRTEPTHTAGPYQPAQTHEPVPPPPGAAPREPGWQHTEFCSLATLKTRGWTDALVRDMLGDPGRRGTNPHYRTAPRMRLYRIERVETAEPSEAFALRLAQANKRRTARGAPAKARPEPSE